jgi:hypothetical protein
VLTGSTYRANEPGALEASADPFLTKPCRLEDLELTIQLPSGRGGGRVRRRRCSYPVPAVPIN